MKAIRTGTSALVFLGLAAAILAAPPAANPAWEKVKSLVGEWEGVADGKPTRVTYKVVSNGTAMMETINGGEAAEMVTIYHLDGASLLMTHYCSMGNQPRMRSKGLENGKLAFEYVDASNLASSEQMRMTRLVMSFPDPDHLVEEWTAKAGGKEHSARFAVSRKK